MINGEDGEVLEKSAAAPDVDGLKAEADAKDGFAMGLGVFEKEEIDGLTCWIGWGGGGIGLLSIAGRVDVGRRAGKEDAGAGGGEGLLLRRGGR